MNDGTWQIEFALTSADNAKYTDNSVNLEEKYYSYRIYAFSSIYNSYATVGLIGLPPTLATSAISNLTFHSATSGGNISSSGTSDVIARGVCWSISQNPTINENHSNDGSGTGVFTSNISGLNAGTTYYVRAYATNITSTAYGNQVNFTTDDNPPCGTSFTHTHDADSVAPVTKTITYNTAQTNLTGSNMCWITQNLGADHQATTATDASEASAGWYWQFNKKQGYKHDGTTRTPDYQWNTSIGGNSDWQAANDPCSLLLGSSWRLPTNAEWMNASSNGSWGNYNNTYASILKLHAAGFLVSSNGGLDYRGSFGLYWSGSELDYSYGWTLHFLNSDCIMKDYIKTNGFSVRCLRNP